MSRIGTSERAGWMATICMLVGVLMPILATAQTTSAPERAADSSEGTLTLVEEFDEEIAVTERRIERHELRADVAVGFGDATDPIEVTVGAVVVAHDVVIVLRNVYGHVRFKASLDRIVDVIESHRPNIR